VIDLLRVLLGVASDAVTLASNRTQDLAEPGKRRARVAELIESGPGANVGFLHVVFPFVPSPQRDASATSRSRWGKVRDWKRARFGSAFTGPPDARRFDERTGPAGNQDSG
jgi:hypothetical protein